MSMNPPSQDEELEKRLQAEATRRQCRWKNCDDSSWSTGWMVLNACASNNRRQRRLR